MKIALSKLTFVPLFLLSLASVFAQGPSPMAANPKMDEFINILDQTSFIKNFKRYRNNTEAKILEVKGDQQLQLDQKSVTKLKVAYKQSQFKFDEVLDQLKRDLANPATRSRIKKSPQLFSATYQQLFDDAKLYCDNEFHQKADALLKKDGDPLALLVLDTLFALFKSFMDRQAADKAFNAAYLETKFIEPLRFKSWDRVTE
jgi:hypothetical protein